MQDWKFVNVEWELHIEDDSQPFVGDLNGDFLDDIIFTDPISPAIKVAF